MKTSQFDIPGYVGVDRLVNHACPRLPEVDPASLPGAGHQSAVGRDGCVVRDAARNMGSSDSNLAAGDGNVRGLDRRAAEQGIDVMPFPAAEVDLATLWPVAIESGAACGRLAALPERVREADIACIDAGAEVFGELGGLALAVAARLALGHDRAVTHCQRRQGRRPPTTRPAPPSPADTGLRLSQRTALGQPTRPDRARVGLPASQRPRSSASDSADGIAPRRVLLQAVQANGGKVAIDVGIERIGAMTGSWACTIARVSAKDAPPERRPTGEQEDTGSLRAP